MDTQPQQSATLVQVPAGTVMVPQYTTQQVLVPAPQNGQQMIQYQTQSVQGQPQQQVVYQYQQQPGDQGMQQVPQQTVVITVPQSQMVPAQQQQQAVQVMKMESVPPSAPQPVPQQTNTVTVAQPSPPPTPDTALPAPAPAGTATLSPAPSAASSVASHPIPAAAPASPHSPPPAPSVQPVAVVVGSPPQGGCVVAAPVVPAAPEAVHAPELSELPPGPPPPPHAGFLALAHSINSPEAVVEAKPEAAAPKAEELAPAAAPTTSAPATGGHTHQRSESVIVHDSQPATPLTQMGGIPSATSLSTLGGAPQTPTGGPQGPYGQGAHSPYGMYGPGHHMQYPGPYPPHPQYANYPPYGGPQGPQGGYHPGGPGGPGGYQHHPHPSFGGREYMDDRMEEEAPRRRHGKSMSQHYKVEHAISDESDEDVPASKAGDGKPDLERTSNSVKSLIARCKRWSVDLGSMMRELESLQVEHLQNEIKELKETVEEKDTSIKQLTEARDKATTDNESKDKEIEELREQVARLRSSNEDLSRGVAAKSGIIDKLRSEYEMLLNELEVKEQTLQQVTKAAAEETEEARKQRVLHTALVELSPSTFDRSFCKIVEVFYTNPMLLCSLVDNIFEVALTDFTAMELNAEIISKLMGVLPEFDDPEAQDGTAPKLTFHRFLMAKCQEEIDQGFKAMDMVGPKNYEPQLSQQAHEAYLRALTMVQFLGCVFKMGALPDSIIHKVIVKVLSVDLPRPQEVECICRLFITVGPTLSTLPKARPLMEAYFGQIETFTRNHMLNPRLRLQLLDLIDLRSNNWILRNGVSAAR